jgi:RimJ/RimL family protein N-acetyltransferase
VKLKIERASSETFAKMVAWRYESPYDFYDGDQEPPLNPERYFAAVDDDGVLVGFYYFEDRGDVLEIGLGLRPDLTGHGLGAEFLRKGLEFGRSRYRPGKVVLNVAAFNERAIKVYERAGFRATGRHVRTFPRWGEVEFVEMEECSSPG